MNKRRLSQKQIKKQEKKNKKNLIKESKDNGNGVFDKTKEVEKTQPSDSEDKKKKISDDEEDDQDFDEVPVVGEEKKKFLKKNSDEEEDDSEDDSEEGEDEDEEGEEDESEDEEEDNESKKKNFKEIGDKKDKMDKVPEKGVDKKRRRSDVEKNGSNKKSKLEGTRVVTIDVDEDEIPISNFRISEATQKILEENGYKTLWPIQSKTYDLIYDGSDVVGRARTGTGKTLSFALPIVEKLLMDSSVLHGRSPRLLVLTPTRELAQQVEGVFRLFCQNLVSLCIYGGIPYDGQEKVLSRGVDILVGTPGRILDHIQKKNLLLDKLLFFVCDEADQMLNMGFKDEIDAVLKAIPATSTVQKLLFSATIPSWVRKIALTFMKPNYITVDLVSNADLTQTAIGVRHLAVLEQTPRNYGILGDIVHVYSNGGKVIIFCETKKEATQIGLVPSLTGICQVIHGDFTQSSRDTTMNAFRENNFQVLVATDVAARGLDIDGVDLIIQTGPPRNGYEQYIHRSGRTGRAGKEGTCVTLVSKKNKSQLKEIEEKAKIKFTWVKEPGPQALYEAAGKRALTFIEKMDPVIISHFLPLSATLVETFKGDTTKALAATLACASGFSHQRSLLGRLFNYETILIQEAQVNPVTPFALREFILSLVTKEESKKAKAIGQIRKTKTGDIVADVPSELIPSLLAHSQKEDKKAVITKISELPPLQDTESLWGARGARGGRGGRPGRGGGDRFGRGGGGGDRLGRGGGGGDRFGRGGGGGGDRLGRGGGGGGGGGNRFGRGGGGGGGGRDFRGRGARGGGREGARGRGMMKKYSWTSK